MLRVMPTTAAFEATWCRRSPCEGRHVGGDVDDAAGPCFPRRPRRRARAEEDGAYADRLELVPFEHVDLPERPPRDAGEEARVVDGTSIRPSRPARARTPPRPVLVATSASTARAVPPRDVTASTSPSDGARWIERRAPGAGASRRSPSRWRAAPVTTATLPARSLAERRVPVEVQMLRLRGLVQSIDALLPTERRTAGAATFCLIVGVVVRVHAHRAGTDGTADTPRAVEILRPQSGREPVLGVVGERDRVLLVGEAPARSAPARRSRRG